jgi:hypothetical protein
MHPADPAVESKRRGKHIREKLLSSTASPKKAADPKQARAPPAGEIAAYTIEEFCRVHSPVLPQTGADRPRPRRHARRCADDDQCRSRRRVA